jgi:hypothetical protein
VHKLLKLYVTGHPAEFGLTPAAVAHIEYPFATGDRVDVMFENHMPDRTVVEVEVEGEREVCIGIHQVPLTRRGRRWLPAFDLASQVPGGCVLHRLLERP